MPYFILAFFNNQRGSIPISSMEKWLYSITGWALSAYSRIYLGQHYFSDVFFSLLYGMPLALTLECLYFHTQLGSIIESGFGFG